MAIGTPERAWRLLRPLERGEPRDAIFVRAVAAVILDGSLTTKDRERAGADLWDLGRPVIDVIPQLREAALLPELDGEIRVNVLSALGRIRGHALPTLLDLIRSDNPEAQQLAVWALQCLQRRERTPEVTEVLLEALEDPQDLLRLRACLALGRGEQVANAVGRAWFQDADVSIAALAGVLQHDRAPRVRAAACEALSRLEGESARVVPLLAAALDDPSPRVQAAAARAMAEFPLEIEPCVERLQILAALPDHDVASAARYAIAVRDMETAASER